MDIYSERRQKEMMDWVYEISVPKDNGDLLCHLVVAMPKKKGIIGRLEI